MTVHGAMTWNWRAAFMALALLAGCVDTEADLAEFKLSASGKECRGPSEAACYFQNSPVRLSTKKVVIPGRAYEFYPLAENLEFVDGQNRLWIAPKDTLTDGASIPEVFVSIIGDPRSEEFTNAAALHDAYCGIGNEDGPVYKSRTWQETHRLFYDGLIVGGTPELKAKLMFAAVWLGGPRWYPSNKRNDATMALLPKGLMQQSLRETKQYIERKNPSIPQLLAYLDWHERRMKAIAYGGRTPPPVVVDPVNPISPGGGGAGAVQPLIP